MYHANIGFATATIAINYLYSICYDKKRHSSNPLLPGKIFHYSQKMHHKSVLIFNTSGLYQTIMNKKLKNKNLWNRKL